MKGHLKPIKKVVLYEARVNLESKWVFCGEKVKGVFFSCPMGADINIDIKVDQVTDVEAQVYVGLFPCSTAEVRLRIMKFLYFVQQGGDLRSFFFLFFILVCVWGVEVTVFFFPLER